MIVATSETEEERMLALRTRAENNGVELETWTGTQVTACEVRVRDERLPAAAFD